MGDLGNMLICPTLPRKPRRVSISYSPSPPDVVSSGVHFQARQRRASAPDVSGRFTLARRTRHTSFSSEQDCEGEDWTKGKGVIDTSSLDIQPLPFGLSDEEEEEVLDEEDPSSCVDEFALFIDKMIQDPSI